MFQEKNVVHIVKKLLLACKYFEKRKRNGNQCCGGGSKQNISQKNGADKSNV